jgi:hypothetical protein
MDARRARFCRISGTEAATPWPFASVPNLVRHFVDEIMDDGAPECTFYDGAKSQPIVDALVRSHHERPGRHKSFLAFFDELTTRDFAARLGTANFFGQRFHPPLTSFQ